MTKIEPADLSGVHVYLPPENDIGEGRILIGTLTNEMGEFVFRYGKAYADDDKTPALSAFPDKKKEYRSKRLWPFFAVRIPPVNRQDIQRLMKQKKIDGGNTLILLGELARKSITTPYELEFKDGSEK